MESIKVHNTIIPPANRGPTTYRLSQLQQEDMMYLLRMDFKYRHALRSMPGAYQLPLDILTNDADMTWKDLGYDSTVAGNRFKEQIERMMDYAAVIPHVYKWDPSTYKGPLAPILGALVANKLSQ